MAGLNAKEKLGTVESYTDRFGAAIMRESATGRTTHGFGAIDKFCGTLFVAVANEMKEKNIKTPEQVMELVLSVNALWNTVRAELACSGPCLMKENEFYETFAEKMQSVPEDYFRLQELQSKLSCAPEIALHPENLYDEKQIRKCEKRLCVTFPREFLVVLRHVDVPTLPTWLCFSSFESLTCEVVGGISFVQVAVCESDGTAYLLDANKLSDTYGMVFSLRPGENEVTKENSFPSYFAFVEYAVKKSKT